jgi:hypothetical protein
MKFSFHMCHLQSAGLVFVHAHSRLVVGEDSEAGNTAGVMKNTVPDLSDLTQSIVPEIPLWQFYVHR